MIRFLLALLVCTLVVGAETGPVSAFASDNGLAAVEQQQPQQPQQMPEPAEPDAETASAGVGNVLWIVIAIVAAAAFVGLALVGLRSSTRE
jgi:hypothetical protein